MNVFLTLLVDSLRLLRARVLFWITLGISALVALIYLSIGFTPEGISILFGTWEMKNELVNSQNGMAEPAYLAIFSNVLAGFWLSWGAVIVALISCAPIFPDFMSEGSIGIPLSKPVRRVTLFFYKYIGSLMFVVLQVAIFCVIVVVAIRWRVGVWNFSVFWAVPIVTLMFSYIYSVVVLVSVKTRSVLAAVLAGIFVWFLSFGGQWADDQLYLSSHPEIPSMAPRIFGVGEDMVKWQKVSEMAMMGMPKTGETTRLMDRLIKVKADDGEGDKSLISAMAEGGDDETDKLKEAITRNSASYVIGTSLLFEALMLGWAASIFCRRDY